MTSASNRENKRIVWDFWRELETGGQQRALDAAQTAMAPDVGWHGHEPVGSMVGPEAFVAEAWVPLITSFPDLRRRSHIFMGGRSNGRVDGDVSLDGRMWVTGTGLMKGTFASDYLGIPATGDRVNLRWGEFCQLVEGRIVEIYFLIDLIDLLQQVGVSVLPPSRGADGLYPPPVAGDGVLLDEAGAAESAYTLDHIRRFIFDGLNAFDESDLASMAMADFFHPEAHWYGPGGIGACLSFAEFEDLHQKPWLTAFPDRAVQDLDALFAEGAYSAAPGWAGVIATHTGPYLDCTATGRRIEFNGLDWWKRDGEQYVENWVFVDMVHLFDQMGVDLLARMHAQN